jgi:hypothetical protein
MDVYRLVDYDTWGNEDDGWEVNMEFTVKERFEVPVDATDPQLWECLIGAGYFPPEAPELYRFDRSMEPARIEVLRLDGEMPVSALIYIEYLPEC